MAGRKTGPFGFRRGEARRAPEIAACGARVGRSGLACTAQRLPCCPLCPAGARKMRSVPLYPPSVPAGTSPPQGEIDQALFGPDTLLTE